MGMNFFLRSAPCEKCGCIKTEKHIGKSSSGWQFHFRGYPEESIVSYEDWQNEFKDSSKQIVNEEGEIVSREWFDGLVEAKRCGMNHYNVIFGPPLTKEERQYCMDRQHCIPYLIQERSWKDDAGNAFTECEFS